MKREDPYERIKTACECCGREFMPNGMVCLSLETDEHQQHDLCNDCAEEWQQEARVNSASADTLTAAEFDSLEKWIEDNKDADEHRWNALKEAVELLRAVGVVLDMSDCEHEGFRDSCADCIEQLWINAAAIRAFNERMKEVKCQ